MGTECPFCHSVHPGVDSRGRERPYCSRACACRAMTLGRNGAASWNKGIPLSDAHRIAASLAQRKRWARGEVPWNKGSGNYTLAMRQKMSEAHLGQVPWNKGMSLSAEHRENLSKAHKGKTLPRERVEKIANANRGKRRSLAFRKTLSERLMGHVGYNKGMAMSEEQKEKIRLASIGKKASAESRRKMRLARLEVLKRCEFEGGQVRPAYNVAACEFFRWFDGALQTSGQYATNGGEHLIKELGYFVDYFNPDLGIIMEWDEEQLHYRNGRLRDKDIRRQEEIMRHFPDYKLIRIREKVLEIQRLREVA